MLSNQVLYKAILRNSFYLNWAEKEKKIIKMELLLRILMQNRKLAYVCAEALVAALVYMTIPSKQMQLFNAHFSSYYHNIGNC